MCLIDRQHAVVNTCHFAFSFLLIFLLSASISYGQLSPGPLSTAHAELEGIRNCTLCHDLGNKVSNAKCLDCHKEIQSLISADQGYHAHSSVKRQDCFACHSEHHGRKFDQTRFDQDNFDHELTGYLLEGQHDVIDCRDCHQPEYIADFEIRKRENTFLGMDQQCLACHDDYHQGTLADDCASCHNFDAFRPAPLFDHEETDYPLRGAHSTVDCIECHQMSTRNGQEFQEFSDIPFNDCVACHDNPHRSGVVGACTQCHLVESFETFTGQRGFNHNRTGFALRGNHDDISCYECHRQTTDPLMVFQDAGNRGLDENNCVACHEDHHEGRYGTDCAQCHNEESFLALNNDMSFFDHTVTDYPLEGMHEEVDCRACHVERFSTPIDFSACMNCHEDYHEGEFVENGSSPDCAECHTLDHGFDYSLYTLEQHQESAFPLEGAHVATPCFACHLSEEDERWHFREIGTTCVDCHQDIHDGYISEQYYPQDDCAVCHMNDAWASVEFDHSQTDWPLDGKHLEVDCRDCHFEMADNDVSYTQIFDGLENQCISCHENVHGEEFAINGVTDCIRCHVTSSWTPENFDHSATAFPLDGRHADVECRACHEQTADDGSIFVIYKIEKFQCIDCHQ